MGALGEALGAALESPTCCFGLFLEVTRSHRRAWTSQNPLPGRPGQNPPATLLGKSVGLGYLLYKATSIGCKGNGYRPRGCAEAEPTRSVCPRVSGHKDAAHHCRWAAEALSLGFKVQG